MVRPRLFATHARTSFTKKKKKNSTEEAKKKTKTNSPVVTLNGCHENSQWRVNCRIFIDPPASCHSRPVIASGSYFTSPFKI